MQEGGYTALATRYRRRIGACFGQQIADSPNPPRVRIRKDCSHASLDPANTRKTWIQAPRHLQISWNAKHPILAFKSHAGLMADFHSLRGIVFVTNQSQRGAHLPLVQSLVRHSNSSLTLNAYTHLTLKSRTMCWKAFQTYRAHFVNMLALRDRKEMV